MIVIHYYDKLFDMACSWVKTNKYAFQLIYYFRWFENLVLVRLIFEFLLLQEDSSDSGLIGLKFYINSGSTVHESGSRWLLWGGVRLNYLGFSVDFLVGLAASGTHVIYYEIKME